MDFIAANTPLIVTLALIVLTIVIIGCALEGFRIWTKHRETMVDVLAAQTAEKAAQYAAQHQRLEQRVQVMERIVTDRGLGVADEIERLRDERPLN